MAKAHAVSRVDEHISIVPNQFNNTSSLKKITESCFCQEDKPVFHWIEKRSKGFDEGLAGDVTPAPCDPVVPQGVADLVWESSGQLCDQCRRMADRVVLINGKFTTRCERCLKQ